MEKLPGESSKAFAARVAYVTAGPGRSLEKVGQDLGHKGASGNITRWSSKWRWTWYADQWDAQQAKAAQEAAAAEYQAQLEKHRTDCAAYGADLCGMAASMLADLRRAQPDLVYTPATLGIIARAFNVGLDIRAHALQVERLLAEFE
jgi:hypothetical protein